MVSASKPTNTVLKKFTRPSHCANDSKKTNDSVHFGNEVENDIRRSELGHKTNEQSYDQVHAAKLLHKRLRQTRSMAHFEKRYEIIQVALDSATKPTESLMKKYMRPGHC